MNLGFIIKNEVTMKKKVLYTAALLLLGLPLSAQDIYKMEMVSGSDLNGTARYVGMGGAMSALGADLSVMGTNPAGIGLYRRSDVALTGSITTQPGAEEFCDVEKTRASFDNIGFVYAVKLQNEGKAKFFNVGFNYHKSRNLKNYIGVNNFRTGGLSQSIEMMDLAYTNGWLDLDIDKDREYTTPLACLGYDTYMIDKVYTNGEFDGYAPVDADSYNYKRVQWGGIHQYDFNLSFNWNDQVYAGMTLGIYDVDIHGATDYAEMLPDENGELHEYLMQNNESLSGNGYDLKLGVILRPIKESPFRIGFALHTPTFYSLSSYSNLYMRSPFQSVTNGGEVLPYSEGTYEQRDPNDYNIRTSWKANLSFGTTVGNFLALDAEYEVYNPAKTRVSYPNGYTDYENQWTSGDTDYALKEEAKRFMKPVSTLRLGAEARLSKNLYGRLGYNFVSAPFEKDAYHNLFTASSSYYFSTNTDYVNLGAINRVTAGLGYRGKRFYADVAYQYQNQKGDLYTFHVPNGDSEQNKLQAAEVDLNRHNFMLTLGYKF